MLVFFVLIEGDCMKVGYRFFGLDVFLREFMTTRILLLSGHKGTGKTLVSVALGYEMMRLRYVINAAFNFPVDRTWAGAPARNQTYGAVDEAGVMFDARTAYRDKVASAFITEATSFLRKTGSFLVVPTYTPPDVRLRNGLRAWRVGSTSFFWMFRWEVGPEEMGERTPENYKTGRFSLFRPSFFYGTYDTYYIPLPNLTYRWLDGVLNDVYALPAHASY